MVLEKLSESLKNTLNKIASSLFVDEKLINELIKDIQRALLQADTNVKLVFELSQRIKQRAKEKTPPGLTKKEQLIKIVYEELTNFLGKEASEIKIVKKPTQVLLVGLFGSGKTTTAAKLAHFYKKRGYKVALLQTDTWRPAAYDQLKQLAKQINVDFYGIKEEKNPLKIYQTFQDKLKKYDLVFIDTAGRDALSSDLIKELISLNNLIHPEESLLVLSADLGQTARKQAEAFYQAIPLTGIIVTKLEGTAKGGGALSACAVTQVPLKFVGTGEKLADLELFYPSRFVSRLIGWGDLETLLEKAKESLSEEQAQNLEEKFLKGDFNLIDLYQQMNSLKKMGSLRKIIELIPGFSQIKLPSELLEVQEDKLKKWRFALDSFTKEELENPDLLTAERIARIAQGSGVPPSLIRDLLKQYRQAKKITKLFKGEKDFNQIIKKFRRLPKKVW